MDDLVSATIHGSVRPVLVAGREFREIRQILVAFDGSVHSSRALIVAAELGHTLLKTPKGVFTLRGYIADLLEQAKLAGKRDKAKHVNLVLTRFNATHPLPRVL